MAKDNIVRALDLDGDWVFGKGTQNYRRNVWQVGQRICTHIRSWYRNCFFDMEAGIDWGNLLGYYTTSKKIAQSVRYQIHSIEEITNINDLSLNLDENRRLSLIYSVDTIYGVVDDKVEILL